MASHAGNGPGRWCAAGALGAVSGVRSGAPGIEFLDAASHQLFGTGIGRANDVLWAIAEGVSEASEAAYLRIFGPGGRVSPREAGHAGFRDPGWIADLARCYGAFGYASRAEDPLVQRQTAIDGAQMA